MQHTTGRTDCQENGRIVIGSGSLTKGFGHRMETETLESRGVLSFALNAQSTLRRPCSRCRVGRTRVDAEFSRRGGLTCDAADQRQPKLAVSSRSSYDRAHVSVGIVHFGVGGFHRAHQAMYVDSLMDQGKALDWGICGGPPTACRNSCCQLSGRISPRGGTFASPRRWSPAGPVMRKASRRGSTD